MNVRDLRTGESISEITAIEPIKRSDQSIHVAYINSNQVIVACGTTIRIHDAATGQMLYELLGHTAPVTSVKHNRATDPLLAHRSMERYGFGVNYQGWIARNSMQLPMVVEALKFSFQRTQGRCWLCQLLNHEL